MLDGFHGSGICLRYLYICRVAVRRVVAAWTGFVSFKTQLEIYHMELIVKLEINQHMDMEI